MKDRKMEGLQPQPHVGRPGEPSSTIIYPYRCFQEDSALLMLPREVLEMILEKVDGLSMVCLSSTCTRLYHIANEVGLWRSYLLQEQERHIMDVSRNFCAPLWQLFSPSCPPQKLHSLISTNFPWKEMYYSFKMCHSIGRWDFRIFCVAEVTLDTITSLKVAGQDVVFGTVKGRLGCWNPDKTGSLLKSLLCMPAEIDEVIVQISSSDSPRRHQIVTHSIDTSTYVYDMAGFSFSGGLLRRKNLRRISSNGEHLFEWDPITGVFACSTIQGDTIDRASTLPSSWIHLLPPALRDGLSSGLPYGPYVAVDIFEQLCISQERGPILLNCDRLTNKYQIEVLLKDLQDMCISRAYIWPEQISLSLTAGGTTIISVGDKCKAIRWPPIFKCVSAALFGNMLMVGTNTGQILFYLFKDPLDLLQLNPCHYHQALDIESHESITFVGVRVQNSIHNFPDVVAATRSMLYCFRAVGFLDSEAV